MIIDWKILDELSAQAKANPRLRMNKDMRTSSGDSSQRMLNALEPGTQVPIHRHPNTSETVIVIRGSLKEILYDDFGNVIETIIVGGCNPVIQIEQGRWHTVEVLESGTIIFEAKDGAYMPISTDDILSV